jgi:Leucine-rich repeat (LRR) protein
LQTLWLDYTRVSDLAPLRGLTGLQRLRLNNTQVSDLAPLRGLTGLQFLSLDIDHSVTQVNGTDRSAQCAGKPFDLLQLNYYQLKVLLEH